MSPYRSTKERAFFHTPTARKKGITKAMVDEYDKASKGMKMPERAGKSMMSDKKFVRAMKMRRGR